MTSHDLQLRFEELSAGRALGASRFPGGKREGMLREQVAEGVTLLLTTRRPSPDDDALPCFHSRRACDRRRSLSKRK